MKCIDKMLVYRVLSKELTLQGQDSQKAYCSLKKLIIGTKLYYTATMCAYYNQYTIL